MRACRAASPGRLEVLVGGDELLVERAMLSRCSVSRCYQCPSSCLSHTHCGESLGISTLSIPETGCAARALSVALVFIRNLGLTGISDSL